MMRKCPVNEVTCTNEAMRFRLSLLLYTRPLTASQLTWCVRNAFASDACELHINKICKSDNEKIHITLTESKVFSTPPPPWKNTTTKTNCTFFSTKRWKTVKKRKRRNLILKKILGKRQKIPQPLRLTIF